MSLLNHKPLKPASNKYRTPDPFGGLIALVIVILWAVSLWYLLNWPMDVGHPFTYLAILIQMHLYTGLFITAHDAMHGTVSSHKPLNNSMGWLAALLFSYNFYHRLFPKHHEHHRFVASGQDPDYHHSGKFWPWYWSFIKTYLTWGQLALMGITFQLLRIWFPTPNLVLYWMLPAIMSTFQLFYFGTYLPHRGEQRNKHRSASLPKNHVWAFLSCYFFGYHYEHHDAPGTPWWRLWRLKD